MNENTMMAAASGRLQAVSRLLQRYPSLSLDELAEVKSWFRKEASALDVGLLASDPSVEPGYRAFRAEHLDSLRAGDYGKAFLWVIAIAVMFGGIAFIAM